MPSKYGSNFVGFVVLLINCKIELKLKWTNHCGLSPGDAYNANVISNNIIFNTEDTKFYLPVVTFSAKDNQKISKRFSKVFERSLYWNEYKTKSQNKNRMSIDIFSNQTL